MCTCQEEQLRKCLCECWVVLTLSEVAFEIFCYAIDELTIVCYDAVEAHSCVDPLMPNSFLSKNTTVNNKSTAGRFCIVCYLIFY